MDRLDRATVYLLLVMLLGGAYGFLGLLGNLQGADWSGVMLAVAFGASPVVAAFLAGGAMLEVTAQTGPAVLLLAAHLYFLVRLRPAGSTAEKRGVRLAELVGGPVPAVLEELHARGVHR